MHKSNVTSYLSRFVRFSAIVTIAAILSLAAGCAVAPPSAIAVKPGTLQFLPIGTAGEVQTRGYVEYVPEGYDGIGKWPCIIFLHGDGELGDGTSVEGMQAFKYSCLVGMIQTDSWDDRHRFIVLAPQFKDYADRSAINVRDFVEYAKQNYCIDRNRIYFSAVSGGGVALGNYLNAYSGGDAAAVVPVSCYVPPTTSAKWKSVPVWFMCGASDMTVKPENVAKNYNSIVNAAPPVMPRITLYTGVGHDGNSATKSYSPRSMDNAFETAYQGISLVPYSNVYDWLLQYRKE